MSRLKFMNTEIDNVSMDEALEIIDGFIRDRNNAYVVTPNVDHIVRLEKDERLREAYDHAGLILTDGKPLIWISKLYGTPIKEKVSGSDLFPQLCRLAAEKGYGMFFLGAAEGVAAKAADRLKIRYPKLKIVGTYSPPKGFENDKAEVAKICDMVRGATPDILIVALGCPKQEIFICEQRTQLGVPVSLGLGATLDFEAGVVKRAPQWMSEHGLEWLFRIMQEPKRMVKRYLIDDIRILGLFWKYRGNN